MMAKTILLAIGILLLASSISAQDAMPTKEETVNYLNKKLMETEGMKRARDARESLSGHSIRLKDGKVVLKQGKAGSQGWMWTFDPAHIKDVRTTSLTDGEVDIVMIIFESSLVARQFAGPSGGPDFASGKEMVWAVAAEILAVPGNQEKVRKAFLHLRDLAKAEDDLF